MPSRREDLCAIARTSHPWNSMTCATREAGLCRSPISILITRRPRAGIAHGLMEHLLAMFPTKGGKHLLAAYCPQRNTSARALRCHWTDRQSAVFRK